MTLQRYWWNLICVKMHLQNCMVILFKEGNWTSNNQIVHWIFSRHSWKPRIIRIYWLKYWIHIDQGQPPPTACLRPIEIFYAKLRMQSKGKATGKTQYKRIETARMTVKSLLLCAVACVEIQQWDDPDSRTSHGWPYKCYPFMMNPHSHRIKTPVPWSTLPQ